MVHKMGLLLALLVVGCNRQEVAQRIDRFFDPNPDYAGKKDIVHRRPDHQDILRKRVYLTQKDR